VRFLTGTVYSKALAIFLAAALGLLGAVAGLSQFVILRELGRSEEREMRAMVQRFSHVMNRDVRPLETGVAEWMPSPSQKPAGKSDWRTEQELQKSGLDFAVIYDAQGSPVRAVINPDASDILQSDPEFFDRLGKELGDMRPDSADRGTGSVLLGGHLCQIALRSLPGGAGWVVGGKVYRRDSWGFFEGLFSASVSFQGFDNPNVRDSKGRHLLELLARQVAVVDASREDQITGYSLIKGLNKLPLGYVSISQPRPLRQEGLRAIQVFLTGICLAGGALVLVVWFLLDRTILARIKDLTQRLDSEKRLGRLPAKLDFRGEDELGALARSIEDLAGLLERTQSLHRAVLEDQTEPICRFDSEFRLTFANAIFLRLFGIDASSLASRRLDDFLPPDAWKGGLEQFEKLSRENPLVTYTHEIRLEGRQAPRWFRSTLRRNFAADGAPSGGQWVMTEITAQIGAQKKMIESERRFRRLFESASDGLLLIEGDTLIVSDINSTLCRMLMLAGSEVLGRPLDQIPVFASCVEMITNYRRRGGESPSRKECRLRRADDTSLFVELYCGGYDVDGVEFVQLSFRNISERVLGEQELRRLSTKLLRLQDEERRRIARELHDSTAQNLSALEMNMSLLEPLVETSNPRAARIVAETRLIAAECFKELRNISYLLHPPLIDEVGLTFALKWFADGFSKRTGIATTVEIGDNFPRLGSEIEMPLFRVAQEAMTNIYRHSGADHAWVTLRHEERFLFLEVRDNGHGFGEGVLVWDGAPNDHATGVGLAGMKERLANVGGKLEIESSPLGSTLSIRLILGLEESAAGDDDTALSRETSLVPEG